MVFWSMVFAICIIIEIAIPALVSIWFAMAAAVVFIISIFVNNIFIEVPIFFVLSLAFLISLRRFCSKFIKTKDILGKEVVKIVKLIDKDNEGCFQYDVKYKGTIWLAFSKQEYQINDNVPIKGFVGNKIKL